MGIQFLLTVQEDGELSVQKLEDLCDCELDPSFKLQKNLAVGDQVDLHCKVDGYGPGSVLTEHLRLLAVRLEDDTIPKFVSMDEADAWLEARKGQRHITA